MDKMSKHTRYAELDVFRGLAIIFVLLYHYTTRYNDIYGHSGMFFEVPYGFLGVQFFFMLSGFLIYMSLENISNSYDFVVNRISRLYPAYWASILITFSVISLVGLPGREVTSLDAVLNMTMLQDWLSSKHFVRIKHVDGAYWTLSTFISFYFIVFLINKFGAKDKIHKICFAWLLVIFVVELCNKMGGSVNLTPIFREGGFFIIGIIFYLIKKYGYKLSSGVVLLLSLLSIYFVGGWIMFCFALLFSLLLYLAVMDCISFVNIKPLVFLGSISYSLYLLHQNIGYVIIRELYKHEVHYLYVVLVPAAISILLAAIVTYGVERPAMSFLRARLKT